MARRRLHDRYFKQAKREGYLARSAYKLIEIDDRHRLFRPGRRVLDLGCAPGSWLQVAAERVGETGVVVGIDLQDVESIPGAFILKGDIYETDASVLLEAAGGSRFDIVLSDMAPRTTGAGDHFHSVRLCERTLDLLPPLLAQGGSIAMKVFEGEQYPALLDRTRQAFAKVKGLKPKATRDVSREMYVIGEGYRGP